jgi:ABC-type multidrug transport system ATPase subunit
MSPLVETSDVVRRFGDKTAVDGVTLTVSTGEVVGLLGANGAGKSTLIKMILGLLPADSGTVTLFGERPSRAGRARLGYVPQGLGLYTDLTVQENLEFVAHAFGSSVPELDLELAGARDRLVGDISLGLRRRTAFAAALSHRPELFLLDEPTSGVGPLGRAELWATIASTAAGGAGVLVSTHYMEEAEQCDRVVMLAEGRVVAEGTTSEITNGIEAVEVDAADWGRALETLEEAGFKPGLVGRRLRMVGVSMPAVRSALERAGVAADVRTTPAGFEEAFVAMSVR